MLLYILISFITLLTEYGDQIVGAEKKLAPEGRVDPGGWVSLGAAPTPALLLVILGREERDPVRPMGRKGLDSEVMTMLGIRPVIPLAMCPSV